MTQKLLCPAGHWLTVDNHSEGQRVKCSRCSAEVVVPENADCGKPHSSGAKSSRSHAGSAPSHATRTFESARTVDRMEKAHGQNGHAGPGSAFLHAVSANGTNGAHSDQASANGVALNGKHDHYSDGESSRSGSPTLTLDRPVATNGLAKKAETRLAALPPKSRPQWLTTEEASQAYATALREAVERRNRKPRTYGVSLAIALFACLQVAPIILEKSFVSAPQWAQITMLLAGLEIVYAVWVALTPDWAAPRVAMLLFGFISTLYAVALGISLFTPPGKVAPLQLDETPGPNVLWFLVLLGGALAVTHLSAWVSYSWRSRWSE